MESVQKLNQVLTIQQSSTRILKKEPDKMPLIQLLEKKGIFEKLGTKAESILDMFAVLVNACPVTRETIANTMVNLRDQVVVLPRIVGG